jgi:hypothetical protein
LVVIRYRLENINSFKLNLYNWLMRLRDLILLQYAPNVCYVQVVSIKNAKKNNPTLQIDLEKKVWSWGGMRSGIKDVPIGNARDIEPSCRTGPIGIYDRTNDAQLSNMANDVIKATSSDRYSED